MGQVRRATLVAVAFGAGFCLNGIANAVTLSRGPVRHAGPLHQADDPRLAHRRKRRPLGGLQLGVCG